jgi:signal peptidase I
MQTVATTSDPEATAAASHRQPARTRRASRRPISVRRMVVRTVGTTFWLAALLIVAGVVVGRVEGYQPLAIRSGSMTPTLGVGDLVLTRSVPATSIRPGQIVTFHDPDLGFQLVTHRVVQVKRAGGTLEVETKGDANKVPEHWSIAASSEVGRTFAHVPELGRVLVEPRRWLAVATVVLIAFVLGASVFRRLFPASGAHHPNRDTDAPDAATAVATTVTTPPREPLRAARPVPPSPGVATDPV